MAQAAMPVTDAKKMYPAMFPLACSLDALPEAEEDTSKGKAVVEGRRAAPAPRNVSACWMLSEVPDPATSAMNTL